MPLFSHSSAEHRLLHVSARQIREEALARQRANATATRSSQAFASTGGVNPNAGIIQPKYDPTTGAQIGGIRTNFDYNSATQAERNEQDRLMGLAGGSTVDKSGRGNARVAAAPTKSSLTTGVRGIAGATGDITKSVLTGQGVIEQAAIKRLREGDPTTGVKGLTDEEIKLKMADPVYQKNIRETMSNTGLGGSFDQKGNFTQSEAIDVLGRLGLTVGGSIDGRASLNVTEDKLKALEAAGLVAGVGGKREDGTYSVQLNVGDRDLQEQYTRRKQEADRSNAALMEVQRREQEKAAAQDTANKKAREGTKDFTSTIDTTAFDETTKQVTDLMTSIKGLTPDLQAAILPSLLGLQKDNADIKKMAEEMKATLSTDAEITASYADQESYYKDQSAKYEALLEKNKDHLLDVANYNKEALEIEKKMIDHDAAVSEQKQAQANIENEKKLRRQLNKLGINTDVQGLTFLNDEIQKGVDALENLKTANNLVSLKAQLAIGKGYALDVKGILNDYEGKYLEITSKTQEALNSVKNSISLAKSERDKEMRSIIKDSYEKKAKNDQETRKLILDANVRMIESKEKVMAQDKADARADKRLEYQEKMALARLNASETRADERAARLEVQDEKKDAKLVYADFKTAEDQQEVKNYVIIRDSYAKAKSAVDAAKASGKKLDIGVAKEIATVLHEKGLDPSSVVKEGEYLRASLGQSWYDNMMLFANAVQGGDNTGITTESAEAFIKALERSTETQRAAALSRMAQPLNRLMNFNAQSNHVNIDPREAATIPELIRPEDFAAFEADQNSSYDYNYSTYNPAMKNDTYEEDPKVVTPLTQSMPETGLTMDQIYSNWNGLQLLSTPESVAVQNAQGSAGEILSSLAPVTQGFDTPISTANYKSSTVAAWGGKHDGLDLAFPARSFVPSITEGTIESVTYNKGGWGLTAVVRAPDGAEIRYSHLSSIDPMLKVGDTLVKGREFAQVGNTGNVFSTKGGDGTHLDFRIKKNGKYIDPYSYTV